MARDGLTLTDPPAATALGASRGRVLEVLQTAGGPVGSTEVARKTGLHPNTARFHLDGLVAAGLVDRTIERRDAPGRPRTLYTSTVKDAAIERRSYRLLAEILTNFLASRKGDVGRSAVGAGEAWARALVDRTASSRRAGDPAASRMLIDILDEIGFAPELTGRAKTRRVLLHRCPFRELAEDHRDVVCGVHLGLMRGVLAELGSSWRAESLEPFVEPHLCVAALAKPRPAGN